MGSGLDEADEVGAAGGGGAGEDEADGVGHDFEDDDPPRVTGFHTSFLRLLGVVNNSFDLFGGKFDFHNETLLFCCFRGAKVGKRSENEGNRPKKTMQEAVVQYLADTNYVKYNIYSDLHPVAVVDIAR